MKRLLMTMGLAAGSLSLALVSAGCTGQTELRATAVVAEPSLVYVSPGLWVVADSELPLFYSDGLYWLYRDGYWHSSSSYWGGWVYAPYPRLPIVIRSIQRPRQYTYYRPRPGQRVRVAPRTRDHRARQPQATRRNERVPARPGRPR